MVRYIAILSVLILAGCQSLPEPPSSKEDAISRVTEINSWDANYTTQYVLPVDVSGTDFKVYYTLSATVSNNDPAVYGIEFSTAKDLDHEDVQIFTQHGEKLELIDTRKSSSFYGFKIKTVVAEFRREFLEDSSESGANFQILSFGKKSNFTVPPWMFSALMEVADNNDLHKQYVDARAEWEKELDQYFIDNPEIPERIKNAIKSRSVVLGMSPEQVRISQGNPSRINRSVNAFGAREQWVYGSSYLYFQNGVLTSWQESR